MYLYYDHNLVAIFIPCIQETTCKLEGQQHNNQQRDNSSVTGGGSCVATSAGPGLGVIENPRSEPRERSSGDSGSYGTGRKEAGHSETLVRAAILK